jgi:DNA-binding IclR family transcriptional regulator
MISPPSDSVPAVERVIKVLEILSQSKNGFSISELSRKIKIPKSSTHRIITTLERGGYLQKNIHSGKYRFGLKLISLSSNALESLELREEAKPFLRHLMMQTNLTVHMAVLERNEAVIIEKFEPQGLIRVSTWIGRRLDVNSTAIGKALIAYLTDEEFDQQFKDTSLARHNDKTIVSKNRLKQQLARIRQLGHSVSDEENEIGFRCVGAPIFNSNGRVVAAVSVTGITSQIAFEGTQSIIKRVKQAAAGISTQLGYCG